MHARVHDARDLPRRAAAAAARRWARPTCEGWWDVDDLTGFLRLLSREVHRYDPARNGVAAHRRAGASTGCARRAPQDKHRDRANIRAHYDLGNDFFALMLDPTMMYSSAWFADADTPLVDASIAKLDRLCRRLDLGPDDHVVEIGTGWGGFAVHAAAHLRRAGSRPPPSAGPSSSTPPRGSRPPAWRSLVEVRHDDYRDLTGTYDKVVSIEMIEAVDWRELDTFFAACQRLLAPDGLMGLQAIVIPGQRYERAKNTEDFIKAFIFPGGCLPSIEAITRVSGRATDLTAHRRRRLRAALRRDAAPVEGQPRRPRRRAARRSGLDERLPAHVGLLPRPTARPAFDEREISVVQCVLSRPGARVASLAGHR